jgi:hypothetical protein
MLRRAHLQQLLLGEQRVASRLPTRLTVHERMRCGRVVVHCGWSAWIADRAGACVYFKILCAADAYTDFGATERSTNLLCAHTHQNQLSECTEGHAQQQVTENPAQTPLNLRAHFTSCLTTTSSLTSSVFCLAGGWRQHDGTSRSVLRASAGCASLQGRVFCLRMRHVSLSLVECRSARTSALIWAPPRCSCSSATRTM